MALTNQQIQLIENHLVKLKVDYLDIQLELIDHISCETEMLMQENRLDFDTAVKQVFQNWQKQFARKSSFYTGVVNSYPKIVLEKLIQSAKKQQLVILGVCVLTFLANYFLQIETKNFVLKGIVFYKVASVLLFLISCGCFLVLKQQKMKTTFQYLFNQGMLMYIMLPFLLLFDIEPGMFYIITHLSLAIAIYFVFSMRLFYLHNQFVSKLKIQ
jgi:hypothetical protein